MRIRFRFSAALLCVGLAFPLTSSLSGGEGPRTRAEISGYTATSRYADVMNFIQDLQRLSPRVRLETIAVSAEGRPIPMMVIGDPVPSSPLDLGGEGRLPIYFQANIHAGEVEGKEAALMLARHLALAEDPGFLEGLVILIAPIFNPDGNEKISPENRTRQNGPAEGVGVRANGQGLDLNRDGMKLESPEVRGLVSRVLRRWDPALVLDSHTHNGSYHEEVVTYVGSLNPNGDGSLLRYFYERLTPELNRIMRETHGIICIPHGDFMSIREPEKGWRPLGPQPRYISNYIGLRNRIGILNENYPYADFRTRVEGAYRLFLGVSEYCFSHREEIRRLLREADRRTVRRGLSPAGDETFAVRFDVRPLKNPVTIHGYEMEAVSGPGGRTRARKTDRKRTYTMPFFADYFARRSVSLPVGYLIEKPIPEVTGKLLEHGVVVERLTAPVTLEVEAFTVTDVRAGARPNQGHRLNTVEGEYQTLTREFPVGSIWVGLAQPLANLASSLLEPESDDGLLVWNFFDRYLFGQWSRAPQVYPVYRVRRPVAFARETVRSP